MEARHKQDQMGSEGKAAKPKSTTDSTIHTVEIDCWHGAHKAYAHRWEIMGAMPWSNKRLTMHGGAW